MTHDESWQKHWQEVMDFMEQNGRRPSKHYAEERKMHDWCKHQKKLFNTKRLDPRRVDQLMQLLEAGQKYRHFNQYR